jgi:hypothetical protein
MDFLFSWTNPSSKAPNQEVQDNMSESDISDCGSDCSHESCHNAHKYVDENHNVGENGTLQLTSKGVGDARLVMFSAMCRGTNPTVIEEMLESCVSMMDVSLNNHIEIIMDIFLIMFEKRDCRGGEKEKKIFYDMFEILCRKYPLICRSIIEIIPEYGSWKDLWQIASEDDRETLTAIYKTCSEQMLKDYASFDSKENIKLSLCAKWTPTEKCHFYMKLKKTFPQYLRMLFPLSDKPFQHYRKKNTLLRNHLHVVEQLMCDGKYADIDPKRTPSVCAIRSRNAFMNIKKDTKGYNNETGNRYPDNEDRVKCRQNWINAVKQGQVKSAQLDPCFLANAMINEIWTNGSIEIIDMLNQQWTGLSILPMINEIRTNGSIEIIDMLNQQWTGLVTKTRLMIEQSVKDGNLPMNNVIPMIDLSPSMNGIPKTAAIGLGIMLAELCDPRFGNVVITFDSNCHIVSLNPNASFSERVRQILHIPMGYSTNFTLAMTRLCEIIEQNTLTDPNDHPAIAILTDEQMDCHGAQMFGYSETSDRQIKKMFDNLGTKMTGTPFPRPRTIHWNLRANVDGFPVEASENNCQCITGYSESLLDLILTGKSAPTPYETMRRKLDSDRYDLVRERVKIGIDSHIRMLEIHNRSIHDSVV